MTRLAALLLLLPGILATALGAAPPATSLGQQIYVPIHSSIFYKDGKSTIELAASLSVHNVDPDRPLTLTRVDYYDTKGKLLRRMLDKPRTLTPFETVNFVVEKADTAGGPGANFVVEWKSTTAIVPPLVEALMASLSANQSLAFTTQGRVIRELSDAQPSPAP